jgi:hypothetical protein
MTSLTDIYPLSRKQSILQFDTCYTNATSVSSWSSYQSLSKLTGTTLPKGNSALSCKTTNERTPSGALTPTVSMTKMIRHEPNRKHGRHYKGPYLLTEVNDNGTVQLRVPTHGGAEFLTWNIRIYALITRLISDLRLWPRQPSMRHEWPWVADTTSWVSKIYNTYLQYISYPNLRFSWGECNRLLLRSD